MKEATAKRAGRRPGSPAGRTAEPGAAMIENLITIMLGILAIVLAAYSLQDSRR